MAKGPRNVVRAHAEEAADAQHGGLDIPAFVHQQLVDRADSLVLVVIDVEADDLRRPPAVALQLRLRNRWRRRERDSGKQQRPGCTGREIFCQHVFSPWSLNFVPRKHFRRAGRSACGAGIRRRGAATIGSRNHRTHPTVKRLTVRTTQPSHAVARDGWPWSLCARRRRPSSYSRSVTPTARRMNRRCRWRCRTLTTTVSSAAAARTSSGDYRLRKSSWSSPRSPCRPRTLPTARRPTAAGPG